MHLLVYVNNDRNSVVCSCPKKHKRKNLVNSGCESKPHLHHCVKSVRSRNYCGPHFPAFGLNTERYRVVSCLRRFWIRHYHGYTYRLLRFGYWAKASSLMRPSMLCDSFLKIKARINSNHKSNNILLNVVCPWNVIMSSQLKCQSSLQKKEVLHEGFL